MECNLHSIFYVRPAWVLSNGLKSRVRPSSGKYIALDKGVLCEEESEGSPWAYFWSDEQESHQAGYKDKTS